MQLCTVFKHRPRDPALSNSIMKVIFLTICLSSALAASVNEHNLQKRQAPHVDPLHLPSLNFPFHSFYPNYGANPANTAHPSYPTNQANNGYNDNANSPVYNNPTQSFYDGYYKHLDTHFLPNNHKCVKPYDLAADLSILSDSADGYPTALIDIEKTNRPDLPQYLPSPAAQPDASAYEVDTSYSCPTMRKRLRSFSRYDGQCWILEELVVDYGYCQNVYCSNYHYGSAFYTRNMCMEHFDTHIVWAYCDNYQDPALRIRQETIRLPKYCSCKTVRCY